MKKYINLNSIKIETNEIAKLKRYCIENDYDPYKMFVYYNDGIRVGFSNNISEHIKIDEQHWMPVHHT